MPPFIVGAYRTSSVPTFRKIYDFCPIIHTTYIIIIIICVQFPTTRNRRRPGRVSRRSRTTTTKTSAMTTTSTTCRRRRRSTLKRNTSTRTLRSEGPSLPWIKRTGEQFQHQCLRMTTVTLCADIIPRVKINAVSF